MGKQGVSGVAEGSGEGGAGIYGRNGTGESIRRPRRLGIAGARVLPGRENVFEAKRVEASSPRPSPTQVYTGGEDQCARRDAGHGGRGTTALPHVESCSEQGKGQKDKNWGKDGKNRRGPGTS